MEEIEEVIEQIKRAALETKGDNVVPTELTDNQAYNIYVRHRELVEETSSQ